MSTITIRRLFSTAIAILVLAVGMSGCIQGSRRGLLPGIEEVGRDEFKEAMNVEKFQVSTEAEFDRFGLKVTFFDFRPGRACSFRLGLTGSPPAGGMGGMHVEEVDGEVVGYGVAYFGRPGFQFEGYSAQPAFDLIREAAGPSGYAMLWDFDKEAFRRLELRGNVSFSVAGLGISPYPTDPLGGKTAILDLDCEEPIRIRVAASKEMLLATQREFDDAVSVGALPASVVAQGSAIRRFTAPLVEVVAGPGGEEPEGLVRGAFEVRNEVRTETWNLTTPKPFHTNGSPGRYQFSLDRVGAAHFQARCTPYCPDLFFLQAAGWSVVAANEDIAALPTFGSRPA